MDPATYMSKVMDAILSPPEPRVTWHPSTIAYTREVDDGSGARWEFDYRYHWDNDDPEIANVQITALRLVTDGADEHPVKLNAVSSRWLYMVEAEIAGDLEQNL